MALEKKPHCRWLIEGSTELCSKSCIGEYCYLHNRYVKGESAGPRPCVGCKKGIRGKGPPLCTNCGGSYYRSMLKYFTRRSLNYYFKKDVPLTPEEYLERFKSKHPDKCQSNPIVD